MDIIVDGKSYYNVNFRVNALGALVIFRGVTFKNPVKPLLPSSSYEQIVVMYALGNWKKVEVIEET